MLDDKLIEAIKKKNSNFLVAGPPGSGKTYTLLELTRYLITTKKINPKKLLIFCFNRRGSKFIREKTTALIGKSILEIPIETFYSFCTGFISEAKIFLSPEQLINKNSRNNEDNDNFFGDIKILNSMEQWKLLKNVIKMLDGKNYPYTFKYINSNLFIENSFIQEVFDFILRAQENLFTPRELSDKFTPFFSPVLSELVGIYSRYIKELKSNHLYNYGMLLEETVGILKNQKGIRDYFRQKYDYILVDELQEINRAQFEIINYLSNYNCIFFGNDDQSIYAFRGSAPDSFKAVYFKLKPENVIFLDKNYRSNSIINDVCKNFICLSKNRIPKEITVSGNNSNGELYLKKFHTLLEEANFICHKIRFLHLKKGIKLEEIAVIIKGLGYETHLIENALIQNGIPFIRRGTRSLLDNKLVKYLLNLMRLILAVKELASSQKVYADNGDSAKKLDVLIENVMLSDIINLEPLYFKKVKILCSGNSGGIYRDLWSYFKDQHVREKENKRVNKELFKIVNFVSAIYELIKITDRDVLEFSLMLIRNRRLGIINYLIARENNEIDNRNRWSNLGDFLQNVKDFSRENSPNSIKSFVNFIDDIIENKFTEEIEESTKDIVQAGSVNILSFHQCKGMEFKAVFIPFINRYYLPAKFIFPQAFDIQIFDFLQTGKSLNIEELKKSHMDGEIRLFYNGITRAKEFLYITSNSSREKSIFFEEMKKIYKSLNVKYRKINTLNGNKKKNKKEMSEIESELDFDLNNMWLIRRRALVAAAKMQHNLKFNHNNYLNYIIILKYFYHPSQWWNFIMPTKNNRNPFLLFPASFSYSNINTFRDCPFKYKVRYYFNLKEEDNISLVLGNIYHEIIRIFFKPENKSFSWKTLEAIIDEVFKRSHFDFKFLKNELKKKALLEFKSFFENLMPASPDNSIIEKKFSFKLGKENIIGRIDQINILDDKNLELVDYKSGSSTFSDKDLKEEMQLKIYKFALDTSKDLEDFKFMKVKMKYICLGNLKKPVYEIPEEYCNFAGVINILNDIISKIKSEKFDPEPKNYSSCLNCVFKVLCPKYYGQEN